MANFMPCQQGEGWSIGSFSWQGFEMHNKGIVLVGSLDRWEKKPKAARWFLEGV